MIIGINKLGIIYFLVFSAPIDRVAIPIRARFMISKKIGAL